MKKILLERLCSQGIHQIQPPVFDWQEGQKVPNDETELIRVRRRGSQLE